MNKPEDCLEYIKYAKFGKLNVAVFNNTLCEWRVDLFFSKEGDRNLFFDRLSEDNKETLEYRGNAECIKRRGKK